jgi:putative MFS transporter
MSRRNDPVPPMKSSAVTLAVLVAALGYFVDLYDLVLFSILRVPSLRGLGLEGDAITVDGAMLLNLQLAGMFVGGLAWGVLGDRRGRLTVLFGSIILYSLANLANAFVADVPAGSPLAFLHAVGLGDAIHQYAVLRFVAGFGLAGELGAGITLVAEIMPKGKRGIGTTIVASVGLCGAVAAGLVGEALLTRFPENGWRFAYALGGGMGLALLVLRVGVLESGLFAGLRHREVARGDLRMLVWPPERLWRFLRVILVGMPIWFAGGVLFVFAPEIGKALGLAELPTGGKTILFAYVGVVLGDLASGLLSQKVRSRKKVLAAFLVLYAGAIVALLTLGGRSLATFYGILCVLGATTGYWVVFVTTASEQFGTNLRATVTTSAPNFVRATAIPVTAIWFAAKPSLGVIPATIAVGLGCVAVGLACLVGMRESFDLDLDYVER